MMRRSRSHVPIEHGDGLPQLESLQALARVWMDGRSGKLEIGGEAVILSRGEPIDELHLQRVITGLYRGGQPSFTPSEVTAHQVPNTLGVEIWKAASKLADKTQMRGTAKRSVRPGTLFRRLSAFPMESETMQLLARVERSTVRVGDTVRLDKPTRMRVLDDLARLRTLGVIQLGEASATPTAVTPPPKMRSRRRTADPEPSPSGRRSSRKDPNLAGRLGRELENLQGMDDWTAVGCNPSMKPEAIERQCKRMVDRYGAIIRDRSQSEECRDLAREICDLVEAAAERISSGTATRSSAGLSPASAYDDGCRFVDQGRWEEAVKAFGLAKQHEPYAPQHSAWLGYAVYHDPSRDLADRQRKGRKLIEKATQMGVGNGDPHFIQAWLLVVEKDLVRAWNHVEVCLRANPSHARALALKDSIQREIKRDI